MWRSSKKSVTACSALPGSEMVGDRERPSVILSPGTMPNPQPIPQSRTSGLTGGAGEFRDSLPNLVPNFVPPSPGFCRERNHGRGRIRFGKTFQRVAQLIIRKPVALGCDQEKIAA